MTQPLRVTSVSIWWWAAGYFAAYVPYSALTKAISSDLLGGAPPPSGLELLPSAVLATTLTTALFLWLTGWWRFAGRRRVGAFNVPAPSRLTLLSGLCASGIIATTTLAYTFTGISIVFMMLLMRGGMLIMAPLVDRWHGRSVRWFSWGALLLSLLALALALVSRQAQAVMTAVATLDVVLYLALYALRLDLMSRAAKSNDPTTSRRYFVEEQLVSAPALLVGLVIAALLGHDELRAGFTTFWQRDIAWVGVVIGIASEGTGIFGALVLLDKRENSFCVPVNRASSVLAGVVAALTLTWAVGSRPPGHDELIGAGILVAAILLLSLGPRLRQAAPPRAPTA